MPFGPICELSMEFEQFLSALKFAISPTASTTLPLESVFGIEQDDASARA